MVYFTGTFLYVSFCDVRVNYLPLFSQFGRRIDAGDLPGYFINGDSAFVLSKSMVVLTNQLEHTNFDHEQSSNRMFIEYVLGSPGHNLPPHPTPP
jgi:hypothetical protein